MKSYLFSRIRNKRDFLTFLQFFGIQFDWTFHEDERKSKWKINIFDENGKKREINNKISCNVAAMQFRRDLLEDLAVKN